MESQVSAKKKVFVAMSGGVDSSVAAALLKKSGSFDVVGVYMKCWSAFDQCSIERDAEDARLVAEKLDIPFFVFDFEREYRERVFNYMVREYAAGRTPNPDVFCNSEIKFGIFLEKALALGADFVATGHYVRADASRCSALKKQLSRNNQQNVALKRSGVSVEKSSRRRSKLGVAEGDLRAESAGRRGSLEAANDRFEQWNGAKRHKPKYLLLTAKDQNKDQSYFLWRLTQEQLRHVIFPIGDYLKSEVREMAREFDLLTADKKDSQGLCFVGKVRFDDFLREHLSKNPGPVVTTFGKILGEHDGLNFYTLGQRHGIKIGGTARPLYVAEKDETTNTLVVAEGDSDPALYKKEVEVANMNWTYGAAPEFPLECEARIRYRQPLQKCTLNLSGEIPKVGVVFDEPQRAVAPGQSAVFYKNCEMLGGGIIV